MTEEVPLKNYPIKIKRCVWTDKEDKFIKKAVKKNALTDWSEIAKKISSISPINYPPKTVKQCRERWHNKLNPNIKLSPWSEQEINIFFKSFKKYGPKWAKLSNELPGRTDNAVKNYFYCRLRKTARRINKGIISDDMKITSQEIEYNIYLINYLLNSYSDSKDTSKPINDKYISDMVKSACITYEGIINYLKEFKAATKIITHVSETDDSLEKLNRSPNFPSHSVTNQIQSSLKDSRDYNSAELPRKCKMISEADFLFITQLLTIDRPRNTHISLPRFKEPIRIQSFKDEEFLPTFYFQKNNIYDPDLIISSYLLCKKCDNS